MENPNSSEITTSTDNVENPEVSLTFDHLLRKTSNTIRSGKHPWIKTNFKNTKKIKPLSDYLKK